MRELTSRDAGALGDFFAGLSAEDRTFFWEDVTDRAVATRWAGDRRRVPRGVIENGRIVAFAALTPGTEWSSHVAEIVLIVAPTARRQGLGRKLAGAMLIDAVHRGFTKVTVNIAADNAGAIAMFQGIGFEGEALLRDHLRSPEDGAVRDLVMLAHLVDETYPTMLAAGLDVPS
jgi:ribosomal protein S18 acetylase RimI-like enzyme